jgi:hypothetical protein
MSRGHKPGSIGPAFHEYLEYLETVEQHVLQLGGVAKLPRKNKHVSFNTRLWNLPEENDLKFMDMTREVFMVDATLARIVRSSVKYKINVNTFIDLVNRYTPELSTISHTVPMRLPHEWCTLIIEGYGQDDMILVAQEQTADDHKVYPELECEADEKFICLNIAGYRRRGVDLENGVANSPNQRLSHFPVEIHAQHNKIEADTKVLYAGAGSSYPTDEGKKTLDMMYRSFMIWHHQFHLQSMLRHKQVAGVRPSSSYRPKRLRKKTSHPQFEHTIIQLEADAPDPSQTGRSIFQPRKRLHQVRGFWRHYRKSGKRVWVKPHWRGDEHLGVIKRDFEIVTHEGEGQATSGH